MIQSIHKFPKLMTSFCFWILKVRLLAWAGLLKHLVLRDDSFSSSGLRFTWFIDFFSPLSGSDHPSYGLSSGLYSNIMQLTRTAREQLSALFRAVIQYSQSDSSLSKTLGLIRGLYFTFPIM